MKMSRIRTILGAYALWLALGPPVLAAEPLYRTFAICAGRFSAEIEHAWLMGRDAVDAVTEHRSQFISLMEATMPMGAGHDALHARIDAKLAHAQILTQATFGQTDELKEWARRRAGVGLVTCTNLLLDS